jgi:hypothetical protein
MAAPNTRQSDILHTKYINPIIRLALVNFDLTRNAPPAFGLYIYRYQRLLHSNPPPPHSIPPSQMQPYP